MTKRSIQRIDIPPKLAKLLSSKKRYLCAYGGRGAGRSWAFALFCLTAGTRRPMKILSARETMASIRESSHALLKDWVMKIPYFSEFYTVEQTRIIGKNGTEIFFRGLQEVGAHNLKSLEGVDLVWIDEAAAISHRSFDMLIPTIRKEASQWLVGWNPQTDRDPVWQQIVIDRADMAEVVHVNYTDNPYCPQILKDEAENMLRNNPEEYEHIWLGKPRGSTNDQVIGSDLIAKAITNDPFDTQELPVLSIDPARYGDDPTAFVVRHGYRIIHVSEHLHLEHDEIARIAGDLYVKHNCGNAIIDVGGGYGGGAKREMLRNGLTVQGFQGSWPSPKHPEYANMRAKGWFGIAQWIRDGGKLPNDRKLHDELMSQRYKYDAKGRKILVSKEEMRRQNTPSPNMGDAIAMSLCISPVDRDKPKDTQRRRPVSGNPGSWGWT